MKKARREIDAPEAQVPPSGAGGSGSEADSKSDEDSEEDLYQKDDAPAKKRKNYGIEDERARFMAKSVS